VFPKRRKRTLGLIFWAGYSVMARKSTVKIEGGFSSDGIMCGSELKARESRTTKYRVEHTAEAKSLKIS
jgi:hypothetical protein